jgi:hypothetical protein
MTQSLAFSIFLELLLRVEIVLIQQQLYSLHIFTRPRHILHDELVLVGYLFPLGPVLLLYRLQRMPQSLNLLILLADLPIRLFPVGLGDVV